MVQACRERFPTLEVCDVCQRQRHQARHTGRAHRALLVADMTVKGWCSLNKVAESSLCKRMARLCEGDPYCFPCRSSEAPSWMKVTRRGISDAMAIVEALGDGIAVK